MPMSIMSCRRRLQILMAVVAWSLVRGKTMNCEAGEVLAEESDLSFSLLQNGIALQHPLQRRSRCDGGYDDQKWLFILSTGRSGSTSVLQMVNAIPGYFLGGENGGIMTEFLGLWQMRKQQEKNNFADAWAQVGPVSNPRLLCELQTYARLTIGEPTGERPSTTGFKEIRHTNNQELDMFLTVFPNAKFIINTRGNATAQADSTWWRDDDFDFEEENQVLQEWARNHPNVSFDLRLEEFSVERFNEMLDWLGVENCRYTRVAHANDGGMSSGGVTFEGKTIHNNDDSAKPGIDC